MKALRQKMIEDLQLRGLSQETQEHYVSAVRQMAEFYGKPPDQITEEQVREYFLYLKKVRKVAPSTFGVHLARIKFFYERTLGRDWRTLDLVRPARGNKLPVVLDIAEVRQILNCVRLQYCPDTGRLRKWETCSTWVKIGLQFSPQPFVLSNMHRSQPITEGAEV